jgi:hypothetical protein
MAPGKFFHEGLGHRMVPLPGVIMPIQPGIEVEEAGEVVAFGSLAALGLAGDFGPEVVFYYGRQLHVRVPCAAGDGIKSWILTGGRSPVHIISPPVGALIEALRTVLP